MRIKLFLVILTAAFLLPVAARAIDQSTLDQMSFLLNQPEWNQWGDNIFDDTTLYDGLTAIYAQAVNDGDDVMVRKVVWAMGETGLAVFVPTIIGVLPDEPVIGCIALGKIPSESGVDALIGMLGNDDQWAREAAAWGLGAMPYDQSLSDARDKAIAALNASLTTESESWVRETISAAVSTIQTGIPASVEFETPER
jgi:HEAT repeat protein